MTRPDNYVKAALAALVKRGEGVRLESGKIR